MRQGLVSYLSKEARIHPYRDPCWHGVVSPSGGGEGAAAMSAVLGAVVEVGVVGLGIVDVMIFV